MASPFSRTSKNKTLYPNQIEIVTDINQHLSKSNSSKIWVERKEIDCPPKKPSKKAGNTDSTPDLDEDDLDEDSDENPSDSVMMDGVSYDLKNSPLDDPLSPDSSDEETKKGKGKKSKTVDTSRYVIIGFDTEYLSNKLGRLKVRDSNGKEKVIGWIKYDDFDGDTEQDDRVIDCDPVDNPNWKEELAEAKKTLVSLDSKTGSKKDSDKLMIKNQLLSYQYWAKTSDGEEWSGICIPQERTQIKKKKNGQEITEVTLGRMKMADFILWALGEGKRHGHVKNTLPYKVYLVGHFTRADFCMFSDFAKISKYLGVIRNTFITQKGWNNFIKLTYKDTMNKNPRRQFEVRVHVRDTMLLTPTQEKSLKAIGETLEKSKDPTDTNVYRKIDLGDLKRDRVTNIYEDMMWVRDNHWERFKQYAIQDCFIVVRYLETLLQNYHKLTGLSDLPVTLTSIGVDLLLKNWGDEIRKNNPNHPDVNSLVKRHELDMLGLEEVEEMHYFEPINTVRALTRRVFTERVFFEENFIKECYHGGRNEQFWFGPASVGEWNDWDLSSCYPTAMTIIGKPDWESIRRSTDLKEFTLVDERMGFAWVEFSFPEDTRYPVLPVRTENGIIFPLNGRSYCCSPEITAALKLKAKLTILHGIVVDTDPTKKVFGEFVQHCVTERSKFPSKTLNNLFWKELCNATYGKTAQGLKDKRIYDLRTQKSQPLPPSKITNPFYAAFITSFARAVLGEVMNAIPAERIVFSCTTDGFLSNATEAEINTALKGELSQRFRTSSEYIKGEGRGTVLEIKHRIKQPLGWKTRGQATLIPGDSPQTDKDPSPVLLAKSSIKLPNERTIHEKEGKNADKVINDKIVDLFLHRHRDTVIPHRPNTSVSEMTEAGADLIEKRTEKWVNMEYDWKRVPFGVKEVQMVGWYDRGIDWIINNIDPGQSRQWITHIAFSTKPLTDITEFRRLRVIWSGYNNKRKEVIRTKHDLLNYFRHLNAKEVMMRTQREVRLSRNRPDIYRLKTELPRAIRHSEAGFIWKSKTQWMGPTEWASHLNKVLQPFGVTFSESEHVDQQSKYQLRFTDQDFHNAVKNPFEPNSIPRTRINEKILESLKKSHPSCEGLKIGELLTEGANLVDEDEVMRTGPSKCPLMRSFEEVPFYPADVNQKNINPELAEKNQKFEEARSRQQQAITTQIVAGWISEMTNKMRPSVNTGKNPATEGVADKP